MALAKNAIKGCNIFWHIASNLVCGLVNSVEIDCSDRIFIFFFLSINMLGRSSASGTLTFYHGYFLKENRYQISDVS